MQEKQKKTQVAQCICFPLTKKYFAGTKWLQKNNFLILFYFLCYHHILSIGNKIINICHNGLKMYPRVSTKYISKTFNYNGWCFAQIFTFILTIETSCIHISGICESCQDWKASLVEENAITDNQKLFPPLGILLSVVNEDPNLLVMNLRTSCLPTVI